MKAQELLAGGIGGRSPACLQMRQHPQAAGEKPAHACIITTSSSYIMSGRQSLDFAWRPFCIPTEE